MSLPGLGRREFLLAGASSFIPVPRNPGATATSCIRIRLTGGPSHIDTFDPKPDAPTEIRGPFRPIRTNVRGIVISELFPLMARQAHRYALIRSVYSDAEACHPAPRPEPQRLPFGEACQRARRAVEAGERFITIDMFGSPTDRATWDMHGWKPFSTFTCYRNLVAPVFDRAFSTLLEDLAQSGLLATTLVVAMGEFGRTPKINPSGGRDHWTRCWTAIMAGGGIRGGQIYGSSDATGSEPREQPVTPAMIEATIAHAMGSGNRGIVLT